MRWAARVACMGAGSCAFRVLVGRREGKNSLGRSGRRWEDNVEIDLREVGWRGVDWTDLARDRDRWQALVNTVMNVWVP